VADRTRFKLSADQWLAFQTALDQPVGAKPKLKKSPVRTGVAWLSSIVYGPVRKLSALDAVDSFDCGLSAQTYVSCASDAVVGFYSLAVGSIAPATAAPRVVKGIAQHPAPVMILARLAVDVRHQGAALGKALLKDALMRTAQAADIAGIRALLVHAKDEPARQWYLYWEFEPSASDPFHLFLLLKDIKALVGH
jgi:GNAT superfamily N-acetyltransferase